MATTIGHALVGLTVARSVCAGGIRDQWLWFAFAVFAANAPDFDHLAGLVVGEPARFHRQATHSLLGLLLFTVLTMACSRYFTPQVLRATAVAGSGYASHLLLDMPWIPWLWPLSGDFVPITWAPIAADLQTSPGADTLTLIRELFSLRNLSEIPKEIAAYAPILMAACWLFGARRASSAEA